jgi:hypothetical protein
MRISGTRKASPILLSPILFFFASLALVSGQTGAPPPPAKNVSSSNAPIAAALSPQASEYVGAETCKTCHEEIYNAWEKTPHWKTTLNTEGGPSKQGCEGCHGPGAEHVAGGGDVSKIFNPAKHSGQRGGRQVPDLSRGSAPELRALAPRQGEGQLY